jgi:hypothetical protein
VSYQVNPTYQASGVLVKAVKTIFLCDYLHSEDLRRKLMEGLNVVMTAANHIPFMRPTIDFPVNSQKIQLGKNLELFIPDSSQKGNELDGYTTQ